ncbi:hypothetical protein [Prosthecobacter sp.]|uniref:hypothetical protein n=1 Tax=Prosthecobacter sp. TaxID=1965333 RepID=UPI003783EE66
MSWIVIATVVGGVVVILFCLIFVLPRWFLTDYPTGEYGRTQAQIKDLRYAIQVYDVDYNRYPLSSSVLSAADGKDISTRSRGQILPMLIGNENAPQGKMQMNPKDIRYIVLPKAQNHKSGTWQDGSELVLSDPWGEPYYIVLDTNNDHQIANPEYGADPPAPDYEKRGQASSPPKTLPLEILIYSSGPDRDPKTWHDNVCSWYPR